MDANAPRSRRGVAVPASATISRPIVAPDTGKRSIRLTVKAQPSKLREVISGSSLSSPVARDALSRSSKNKKPIIDASSDEEDEEAESDEEDEEDTAYRNKAEDVLEEEDEMSEIIPSKYTSIPRQPPRIKVSAPGSSIPIDKSARKPSPNRVLKLHSNVKSVEDKEMEDTTPAVSDDEDLSSVTSQDEDEGTGAREDDMDEEDESAEDSEDLDRMLLDQADDNLAGEATDPDTSDDNDENDSNSGTPDITKLTRRQRAAHFGEDTTTPSGLASFDGGLMALSNDPQKKKFFTAEQLTMRRAEMARRRKDLSEKRMEEEKADTLQRLLHKPSAPKRRTKAHMSTDAERDDMGGVESGAGEDGEPRIRVNPLYVRTVMNALGTRVGVPREWAGTPVGQIFQGSRKGHGAHGTMNGRLVVEVEE